MTIYQPYFYVIQDIPYMNDRYHRLDSVITLKYHKRKFMNTKVVQ